MPFCQDDTIRLIWNRLGERRGSAHDAQGAKEHRGTEYRLERAWRKGCHDLWGGTSWVFLHMHYSVIPSVLSAPCDRISHP